jgi:Protein of unknown function (DUF998)
MIQRMAACASLALAIAFFALLAVLHFLEPEFNTGHLISEYQLGDYGLLMSLAFCVLGASAVLLAIALRPGLGRRGDRAGAWGLAVIGAALLVSGLFPPIHTPAIVGYLHGASGFVVILGAPIAFAFIDNVLARGDPAFPLAHRLRWATLLAWGGLVSFLASLLIVALPVLTAISQPGRLDAPLSGWVSLANRFLIVTYCVWLIAAAWSAAPKRASISQRKYLTNLRSCSGSSSIRRLE